jgi:pectin methylesterase-like acyl-CoA thioesterase
MLGSWLFSIAQERNYDFVVAKDGSGYFTTVQAAINAVPDYRKAGATRILIRKGIYKEKIVYSLHDAGKALQAHACIYIFLCKLGICTLAV